MLATALSMSTPTALRFPKTLPKPFDGKVGDGLEAREVSRGDGSLCVLAVGKMAPSGLQGARTHGRRREQGHPLRRSSTAPRRHDDRRRPRPRARRHGRRRHATRRRRHTDGLGTTQPGPGPRPTRSRRLESSEPPARTSSNTGRTTYWPSWDSTREGLAAAFSRLLADKPEFAPVLPNSAAS
jgi:hypothetical protein